MSELINYVCEPLIKHQCPFLHLFTMYIITVHFSHNMQGSFWKGSMFSTTLIGLFEWYTYYF